MLKNHRKGAWRLLTAVALLLGLTAVLPATPAHATDYRGQLNPGQTLYQYESLWSPNGLYRLHQQQDGNLVMQSMPGGKPLWANGMNGKWGTETRMQHDGNVVSVHNSVPVWTTHTHNNWGSTLHVQDDANVVVRRPGNVPIWATGFQHQGNCNENDRARSEYYARTGLWRHPVAPVTWSDTYWAPGPNGAPIKKVSTYKLEYRYNDADRCGYALISGTNIGGSHVYLDRSTNGGGGWTGWLNTQQVSAFGNAQHTGVLRDGRGFWVRACSPGAVGNHRCTGWF